ncbi:MAG: SDR family NAD(P)-dependent oxidoreductase, partial [Proteobacteria bacterium]|nr:SDR family NAD(P)-dependent oxidoreductase [Pseudomonadota bacterium]
MMTEQNLYAGAAPVTLSETDPGRGCRRLLGRTVLITGAARGIGFATAARLGAEGAQVWIADRDEQALAQALAAARTHGLTLRTLVLDSSDATEVRQRLAATLALAGRIDILVNNAGGSLHTPYLFLEESDEDWARVMNLNLMGAV